jgi:hypothetical protein
LVDEISVGFTLQDGICHSDGENGIVSHHAILMHHFEFGGFDIFPLESGSDYITNDGAYDGWGGFFHFYSAINFLISPILQIPKILF